MKPKQGKGQFNPAVKQTATFGKKKVKVGRILPRSNVTDSTVTSKKVVLLEQLKKDDGALLSHRGLSLDDLCKQLGHYNESFRRDAIIGVKQLLESNKDQIAKNLRIIVPCIGNQISNGVTNSATRGQLKALIKLICSVSSAVISSHFDLLLTHVLTGLSDIRLDLRLFAFDVLLILMKTYPELCSTKIELFESYLLLMSGQRRPAKVFEVCKSISAFLSIFGKIHHKSHWKEQLCELSIEKESCTPVEQILPSRSIVDFPVLYSSHWQQINGSPLFTSNGLIRTCKVLCEVMASLISEPSPKDKNFVVAEVNSAVESLSIISKQFMEENCPGPEFMTEFQKAFNLLAKCSKPDVALKSFRSS